MPRASLKVGDLVNGNSKLLQRKRGRITEVCTGAQKKQFRVEWDDTSVGVIFGRSLKKIEAVGDPPPVIGPTILGNVIAGPLREDDNYSENAGDSDADASSDGQEDLEVENEVHPEDGLILTPEGEVARYVKNRVCGLIITLTFILCLGMTLLRMKNLKHWVLWLQTPLKSRK